VYGARLREGVGVQVDSLDLRHSMYSIEVSHIEQAEVTTSIVRRYLQT